MALPPLELFSLERKGRLLPGGLFVATTKSEHAAQKGKKNEPQRIFFVNLWTFFFVTFLFALSGLSLPRSFPRLRVFPTHVDVVIEVKQESFTPIEKSSTKDVVPREVQRWTVVSVD